MHLRFVGAPVFEDWMRTRGKRDPYAHILDVRAWPARGASWRATMPMASERRLVEIGGRASDTTMTRGPLHEIASRLKHIRPPRAARTSAPPRLVRWGSIRIVSSAKSGWPRGTALEEWDQAAPGVLL